jgi:glycosyltransferase involved in cell wall biosynthesis
MIDSKDHLRLVWLGPIVDESTLAASPAVSPAANRWQQAVIQAINGQGGDVFIIGHLPEPVWPRGQLWINKSMASLPPNLNGSIAEYFNFPKLRNRSIAKGYHQAYDLYHAQHGNPTLLLAYNASPANDYLAQSIRKRHGIPWIAIVADDEAPKAADGYVFLSWSYFTSFQSDFKIHLDGGVSRLPSQIPMPKADYQPRVALYSGAMNQYGGVELLVEAFHNVTRPGAELWLCGKGQNAAVNRAIAQDTRIKSLGFVSEEKLINLSKQADIFVNPRPSSIPGNERNFPSKILEYLTFGKPVVSTWTPGLAPEYRDVLIVPDEENPQFLAQTIDRVFAWECQDLENYFSCTKRFLETTRTWELQARRLLEWLTQGAFTR